MAEELKKGEELVREAMAMLLDLMEKAESIRTEEEIRQEAECLRGAKQRAEEQKWKSQNEKQREAGVTLALFKTMMEKKGESSPETTEKVHENIRILMNGEEWLDDIEMPPDEADNQWMTGENDPISEGHDQTRWRTCLPSEKNLDS